MGDTVDYAADALRFNRQAWEFGHLWWVPLAWAVRSLAGVETKTGVVRILMGFNWIAGLACVMLLRGIFSRASVSSGIAGFVTLTFLSTHAFLNYTLTGSSYVSGLAFLLLALFLNLNEPIRSAKSSLGAGLALGAAICFWFPYVLALPGVLLAPLLLDGFNRTTLWSICRLALMLSLLVSIAYGVAILSIGIADSDALRTWITSSTHGITISGAARSVFGFARSFIAMGDDGVLFKRFLLKDPYNPVSLADLIGFSLWKFLFFYFSLVALGINLLAGSARARRLLLLAVLGSLPVICFGIRWQGGDMERYMPLYPFFFLAFATSLSSASGWAPLRLTVAAFFLLAVLINSIALSSLVVGRHRQELELRLGELPNRLPPESRLFVVRDRLALLPRDFPLEPATSTLAIVDVVTPGLATIAWWQQEFATQAELTWQKGGQVWLSKRLFAEAPRSDSTWVEGDDPRVKWRDVPAFFNRFEVSDGTGGNDGFVLVMPSTTNHLLLRSKQLTKNDPTLN
jgi:hypothetical protein